MQQIEHFFTHYKDLEPKKWVRIGSWGDASEAKRVIIEAIEAAKNAKFKKIYEPWKVYRQNVNQWFSVAEAPMQNIMLRKK